MEWALLWIGMAFLFAAYAGRFMGFNDTTPKRKKRNADIYHRRHRDD